MNQGENTGRWTAEEHLLFLQGLEQFGKGWKNIASLIKSRTVVQIRTHAQKYFQKLAKANPDNIDTSTTTTSTIKKRRNSEESSTTLLQGIQTSAHPQSNNVGTHTNGQNKTKRRKTMHELPIPLPPSHPTATTTVPATIYPVLSRTRTPLPT
jgi:SHAQKYF class myb-like DNA-binding protein